MREAAMVSEAKSSPFETGQDIEIGRFRRKSHGSGRESGLAVESGARQTGAG